MIFAGFATHGDIKLPLEIGNASNEGEIQLPSNPFLTAEFSLGSNYDSLKPSTYELPLSLPPANACETLS
ncbi:MAG: hypothetical protein MUP04_08680 [Anaerolineae bacterium]|nr:hypothetical protein [Anaerolineae bacterium]